MAFSGTKLETVTVPASVTVLAGGDYTAFYHIETLKEIKVSSSNQYFSDKDGVLFNKDQTELIRYPVCKTTREYTVPHTVSYIHSNAFDHNKNLQVLTIPKSVQQIENYLTEGCDNLQRIVFQGDVPSCSYPHYAFSWDGNLIYYPANNKTWTKAVIDEFENDGDGNTMVPYDPNLPSPTITAGNNYTTGKIKLSWKAVKDAKAYYIYRSDSKYGEYTLIASTGSTTYTDTSNNLSAGYISM
jgi:hypothetical protein